MGQDLIKGTLGVWKSKVRYLKKTPKDLDLINISWKFEEVIFIDNKDMSFRTFIYNAFLNMTSLMSIITFWT